MGLDGGKWESAACRPARDNRIGLALQWTTGQCAYVTSVCEAWAVPKAQVTKTMERLLPEAFAVPREYP